MSSMYELTSEYQQLLELAEDPDTDPQTLADTFEGLTGEIEQKAEGYAKVMKIIEADISVIDAEIKRLQNRKRSLEKSHDRMKEVIYSVMKLLKRPKIKTSLFSFSIAKNGGLAPLVFADYFAVSGLENRFQKVTVEANNDAIRKAIEAGEHVPGVAIGERGEHLNIR